MTTLPTRPDARGSHAGRLPIRGTALSALASLALALAAPLAAAQAAPSAQDAPAPAASAPAQAAVQAAPARDAIGDPLPAGAVARLGSLRLRHPHPVMGVAFSADGGTLYSIDTQCDVKVWDASSGELLRDVPGGEPAAMTFSVAPDGSRIAISRTDGPATVIDGVTGETLLDLGVHGSRAALAPDGRFIAAWGPPFSKVDLLDGNGETLHEMSEAVEEFPAVVFSPDAARIALVGVHRASGRQYSSRVTLRDTATGETLFSKVLDATTLLAAGFSPDGRKLAAGDDSGGIHVWDAGSGEEVGSAQGWAMSVRGVTWSGDGKYLAVTASDSPRPQGNGVVAFTLRDASTLAVVRELGGAFADVSMLAIDGESRRIASSSRDGIVRVWDLATSERLLVQPGHQTGLSGIAASADGSLLLTAGDDGQVGAWNAKTAAQGAMAPGHERTILAIACSPDGRIVATSSADGLLRFGATSTGENLGGWMSDPAHALYALAFSPTAPVIACANADGKVRLHDVGPVMAGEVDEDTWRKLSEPLHELDSGGGNAFSVAFSPDGKWVATGASRLRLYDAATGELKHDVKGTSPILSIAFSPDGKTIATAYADTKVRLYDAPTLAERYALAGHASRVKCVAFSTDGRTLASVGEDETVIRLWDTERQVAAGELAGHQDTVRAVVALSPNRLASASADGTALIWELPTLPATTSTESPQR